MSGAAPSPRETGLAAGKGAAWAFASTLLSRLVSLAALAVLTRLLTPTDFGTLALALVFITYAETIGDLGSGAALIHWPGRREEASSTVFWVGMAMGWFWWIVAQLAAPWLAEFFHRPESASILRVLAFTFPIKALGSTHDALCQKDLHFRRRMAAESALFIGKAIVSIGLALGGWGVWSLVFGQLTGTLLWVIALWRVVPWRPSVELAPEVMAPLLRYGRAIVAVNVIAAIVHHTDLIVVGRMQGTDELGLYQIAYKIPEISVALLIWVVGKVLFPAFSRVQTSRQAVRQLYLQALRLIGSLAMPAAAGLFLLAAPIVEVFFGPRWLPAAPMLQGIAVYMGLRALGSHAGDVLKGTGRPGLLAMLGVIKAMVLIPVIFWAGGISAAAVAWSMAGVTVITVGLNLWIVSRLLEIPSRRFVAALGPMLLPLSGMVGVLILWLKLCPGDSPWLRLVVALPLGAVTYLAGLSMALPEVVKQIRSYLGRGTVPADGDSQSEMRSVISP